MTKLHYFQRYDSKENWITNSTLLLLSRLYHYNRLKFESAINTILAESNISLDIGVNFAQQHWGESSVVDGVITQHSFKIAIETKLYDNFSSNQLVRHLDSFPDGISQKILLALSKSKINENVRSEVIAVLQNENYKEIKFASTTYEEIYQVIYNTLGEADLEMKEILEDYFAICAEHGLTNLANRTMLAVTAKLSISDNINYRIYYDPSTRTHSYPFKYIGLYDTKAIRAVGMVEKVICCNYEDGKLVGTNGTDLDTLTPEEYDRIKSIIENTEYYDLEYDNRFYLVDNFHLTTFTKTSFSSLRAKRYFWLDETEGFKDGMPAEQVAKLLDGAEWE